MKVDFKCKIGDTLYYVDSKKFAIYRFTIDCFKVFDDNITAHGYMYGKYNNGYGYPMDISIKYIDKRVVFTKRKVAQVKLDAIIENERIKKELKGETKLEKL